MPITINDIARRAHVSKATVSYVINNKPGVSEETRIKVRKIMKEMNYRPNSVARGLAGKATEMIGLIIPDITDMFYAKIISGVENTTNKHNYTLNLCTTHANPKREKEMVDYFTNGRVDGVILMTYFLEEAYIQELKNKDIPFVFIDGHINSVFNIMVDNKEAGYQGTEYLINLGHKKIAFIQGSADARDNYLRYKGYCQALDEYHLPVNEQYIKKGNFQKKDGYEAALKLLKVNPRPTAIFAANDQMAIGALIAIQENNLKVPVDISILGMDDIEAASLVEPGLTTIRQPTYQMGEKAVEILFKLFKGQKPKEKILQLKTELVKRGSCAAV